MLSDKKVLITGATGQIARPVAELLVTDNEVWCAARFTDPEAKREVEELGIRTVTWDLAARDNSMLDDDFTHVLHSAALMVTEDHEEAIRVNAEGTGLLMQHCRNAEAFVYVSTSAVYRRQDPEHAHKENDPLGGYASYGTGYPIGKMAAEGAVRAASCMLELPATIARMNIGYGTRGHAGLPAMFFGMMQQGQPIPVPIGHDNWGSPIHEDDIAEQGAGPLFDIASVPTTVVNWAGNDPVSTHMLCDYLGEVGGLTPEYLPSEVLFDSFVADTTKRESLIGPCKVEWHDGVRRSIEALFQGAI